MLKFCLNLAFFLKLVSVLFPDFIWIRKGEINCWTRGKISVGARGQVIFVQLVQLVVQLDSPPPFSRSYGWFLTHRLQKSIFTQKIKIMQRIRVRILHENKNEIFNLTFIFILLFLIQENIHWRLLEVTFVQTATL